MVISIVYSSRRRPKATIVHVESEGGQVRNKLQVIINDKPIYVVMWSDNYPGAFSSWDIESVEDLERNVQHVAIRSDFDEEF